jgi:hypothetical protein
VERGDQRLLEALDLLGRLAGPRAPTRERLRREIGAVTLRRLVPEADARSGGAASTCGSRRVA